MARPTKQGLDYFSLDVEMDDETEIIKAEHGMAGFGVLIAMFQSIYKDKGYYRKWDERNQILFSKRVYTDKNLVIDVINDCINWGIFNKKMYEKYQILTSNRIQRQYINATYRRTEVKLYSEYLLVDEEKLDRGNITCISVSDIKNHTGKQDNDEQQSTKYKDKDKDKESKVNNNVRNKDVIDINSHNMQKDKENQQEDQEQSGEQKQESKSDAEQILNYARQKIITNQLAYESLIRDDLEDYSKPVLKKAIDLAVEQQEQNENYKRGDPKNGVDIGSWRYIQCFIEQAKRELEGGNQNGRGSESNQQGNGESSKDEGARLQEKAFKLMGFEEE